MPRVSCPTQRLVIYGQGFYGSGLDSRYPAQLVRRRKRTRLSLRSPRNTRPKLFQASLPMLPVEPACLSEIER